jgi:hypothetical protein
MATINTENVQKLYLAYFGRPADPAGQAYWEQELPFFTPATPEQLQVLADGFSASPEFLNQNIGLNNSGIVNNLYLNLFGRSGEPAGIAYWAGELNSGRLTFANIAITMIFNASPADVIAMDSRAEAATAWTAAIDTPEETLGYQGTAAFAVANAWLAPVNSTETAAAATAPAVMNAAIAAATNTDAEQVSTGVFTLTESVVAGTPGTPEVKAVYWGYNPPDYDGHHHGSDNGTPSDGGIPVADLVSFLTTITGLDFKELGLIDADGQDPFQNVTSITLSNPLTNTTNGEDNHPSNELTIKFADGTFLNAEVALGTEYFNFLNNLLFDEHGNTRLFEKVIEEGTSGTDDSLQPIMLTTTQNNGGTIESGFTNASDEIIVAGRLDLLHGAYIDAGGGYDILEVDAKGTFAQPKQLLNIEEVRVENLPNVYTFTNPHFDPANSESYSEDVAIDGYLNNSTYPLLSTDPHANPNSILDLSRATSIEKLVVTEGAFTGAYVMPVLDEHGERTGHHTANLELGTLTIVGIRNGATARFEGGFTKDVTLQYGQGLTGPLTVELLIGQVTANLNFAHNTDALNLVSLGGEVNTFGSEDLGGRLSNLTISGDAALYIRGDLDHSFQDESPVTIDASANEKGVALELSHSQNVTFLGSQGDDFFTVSTCDKSENGWGNVYDDSVTIIGGEGNNRYHVETSTATITDNDGNNDYEVSADVAVITTGDGNNHFDMEVTSTTLTVGDGDNLFEIASYDSTASILKGPNSAIPSNVTIVAGDGNNRIVIDQSYDVGEGVINVTTGNGLNIVTAVGNEVNITTGAGNDVIMVQGRTLNISTGAGNDKITISGLDDDYTGGDSSDYTVKDYSYGNGALINIDTGTGSATVELGMSLAEGCEDITGSITAMEGSSITGENITLFVNTFADLRAAELTGVTRVVMDDDAYDYADHLLANEANSADDLALLTLTSDQFAAIGADNFSVQGAIFNTHAFVKIIVTDSTSLTALGVNDLPRNIDLYLELQDGVTLTMTAKQLHEHVAPNGVTLVNDGNTDLANGKVVITGGGIHFDPFNTSDTVRTVIDGTVYIGGSLSTDFAKDGKDPGHVAGDSRSEWYNVTVKSVYNGYDRPADAPNVVVLAIDSSVTQEVGAFSTWYDNLEIVGDQDINFTGAINLAQGLIANSNKDDGPFNVDFSALEGVANNLTLDGFEHLAQGGGIYGNGNNGYASEVLIQIAADDVMAHDDTRGGGWDHRDHVGFDEPDAHSLVSQGVSQYTVTVIEGPTANGSPGSTATIKLCDTAQDIEVFALRGNYNDTLVLKDAAWGLAFELQGGGTAKSEGPTGTSNVGALKANYEWDGADAVVTLTHSVAGDTRPIHAAGITIDNADSITLNGVGGDVIIESVEGNSVETLNINADQDVTINAHLPDSLTDIDASGVDGLFTASIDSPDGDFEFTGAAGGSNLTLQEFTAGSDTKIDGGAAGMVLTIGGDWSGDDNVDLSKASLLNIDSVVLDQGALLNLTITQMVAIGAENFILATGATAAELDLADLDGEAFALADFAEGITIRLLSIANLPEVHLNAATDLTGIGGLEVPEGTVLFLTAAQFQQLDGDGTITGKGSVQITDMSQDDVGVQGADLDLDHIDLTGENSLLTITLAESVDLSKADIYSDWNHSPRVDIFNVGADLTLTLGDIQDANGVAINGGTNSTLKFTDTSAGAFESIDASGFDVDTLKMLNVLVDNRNIDLIFTGLSERVTKVIYNGQGWVDEVNQTVTIEAGTTVPGFVVLNKPESDVEIQYLTLNMAGGTEISGNLRLSSSEKPDGNLGDLIHTHLKMLTINSTGTSENLLTGETANVIDGYINPQGTGYQVSYESVDNNLLDIVINATQDLIVEKGIIFSSVVGDDAITANDDYEATATVTVNGSADVSLGVLDTSDNEVDSLNVINNSTGTLSLTLDDTSDGDTLSFTGANIEIKIDSGSTVDLSDDVLSGVEQITIDGNSTLTLTQAQFNAIGVANILTDDDPATTAYLNIVDLGSAPFDATALADGIIVESVTIAAGNITLNPATNLTGVELIIVPEGSTLNLTAAQFQQLEGIGSIIGLDVNGDGIIGEYTVNITDLTQADIVNDLNGDGDSSDAGESLDLTGIIGATKTLSLAEDVNLAADTNLGNLDALTVILADGQTLGLASSIQANGLNVDGGANTTLIYQFSALIPFPGQIDASGYDVTTLKALASSFVIGGPSNVEYSIDDLASAVVLSLYEDPADLGFLDPTFRKVVIEPGITTPSGLVFNDWDPGDEVRTLTLTFEGGVELNGNLSIPTRTDKDGDLVQRYFDTLTINSTGNVPNSNTGETANVIDGNINTATVPFSFNTSENNLLKVVINAAQDFVVDGNVVFNSIDVPDDDAVATLTITGTADVTVGALIVTDTDISVLNIANDGSGTFTVTGGSPAVTGGIEELVLSGTGDMVFGSNPDVIGEWGISAANLSVINASALSGDLDLGEIKDIDSQTFAFTAGTGVTKLVLTSDVLDAQAGPGVVNDATWSFDLSDAAAGSEFHIGAMGPNAFGNTADLLSPTESNALTINMGANATLYIDADTDFSKLDSFSYTGVKAIVLKDGATLTLTAAQANGLHIVAGPDLAPLGTIEARVNIVGLGDSAVDLSGIAANIAGVISLEDNDVTLAPTTNLGNFAVALNDVAGDSSSLAGQTIRFQTVAQAERDIIVNNTGAVGDSSANVVWLFTDIAAPVDTSGYDAELGRLMFKAALVNNEGGLVENLFTTLPSTILRVDFATVTELNILLSSSAVNRTMELANFTTVGNLTFDDIGLAPVEHLHNLTLDLGGQVTVGNISVADVVGAPGYDPASVSFDTLTINSHLALTGRTAASDALPGGNPNPNNLATEAYVNNNNGVVTTGETAQPSNINVVGNLGVGTDNGVDLLNVALNTFGLSIFNDGSSGDGANLDVGTITFETDATGKTALLEVDGDNNVTIKSVNTTDTGITALTVDLTDNASDADSIGFNGALKVTGANPALQLDNTETLTITNGYAASGEIKLGSDTNAGVSGNTLSNINAEAFGGKLDLGTLALIDGTNDDSTPATTANDGLLPAFTFKAGDGVTTATLGELGGSVQKLVAGSEWVFDYSGSVPNPTAGSKLTLTSDVEFEAGAKLTLIDVPLEIKGSVDLSKVVLSLTGGWIVVPVGQTLTLSVAQAQALPIDIIGGGTIKLVGDASNQLLGSNGHLKTVGVDISGVTLIASPTVGFDTNATVELILGDANIGTVAVPELAGHTVTGSALKDAITLTGTKDSSVTAGAADDTITAAGTGSYTYNVTAGTDTIVGMGGELATGAGTIHDVLKVSAGATAQANVTDFVSLGINGFIATSATVNDGTANLTGGANDNTTIDVSLAGGSKGFTLNGGSGSALGKDILIGSNQADIINGGNNLQTAAAAADVLTGNGGADTFQFDISKSSGATITQAVQPPPGQDGETIAVNVAGSGNDVLRINYTLNGAAASTLTASVDLSNVANVLTAISNALTALPGVTSTTTATLATALGDGINSFEISSIVAPNVATDPTFIFGDDDKPSVQTLTYSGTVVAGEKYTVSVGFAEGGSITAEYTAVAADVGNLNHLANGIASAFNSLAGVGTVSAAVSGAQIIFTDEVADNGGFTLVGTSFGTVDGTGASASNAADPNIADLITDFLSGTDKIDLNIAAGSAANYKEAVEVNNYATALSDADAAFDGVALQYYLTSVKDIDPVAAGDQTMGVLLFDANLDGTPDGVIQLTGINSGNFAFTDIIA